MPLYCLYFWRRPLSPDSRASIAFFGGELYLQRPRGSVTARGRHERINSCVHAVVTTVVSPVSRHRHHSHPCSQRSKTQRSAINSLTYHTSWRNS